MIIVIRSILKLQASQCNGNEFITSREILTKHIGKYKKCYYCVKLSKFRTLPYPSHWQMHSFAAPIPRIPQELFAGIVTH